MKANRKFRRFKILIVFICLFAVATLIYFQRNVTRVLISISEATIRSVTTVAVNDAIYYTLNDSLRYEDLITIDRDAAGHRRQHYACKHKINENFTRG